MKYKLKITRDNEIIFRAKVDKIENLEPVFKYLKKKFKGGED